jgi:hypothetical protein
MAPTVESLITSINVELEQAQLRRERAKQTVEGILAAARADGRATLSADEESEVQRSFKAHEDAESDLAGIRIKLESAKKVQRLEAASDAGLNERKPNDPLGGDPTANGNKRAAYDEVARVGREERTYHPGNCRKGAEFVRDIIAQYAHRNPESEHRLARHMQEERVERGQYLQRANVGTSNFSGLVVPQYLTELYAPAVAALRPFADVCNQHDLPPNGMTVNISRITTRPARRTSTTPCCRRTSRRRPGTAT